MHTHLHQHSDHGEVDHQHTHSVAGKRILTIRPHSGLAGDMFLCGLLSLLKLSDDQANEILNKIFPSLKGSVHKKDKFINGIRGSFCEVNLPHEHTHRNLSDVLSIIESAKMSEKAKQLAISAFTWVAKAESVVHGKSLEEVHFHEVGALDSILDICFTSELFVRLDIQDFIVGPLPIADGHIHCAHGVIPCPAPAVQALLKGVPVRAFDACGETVTPTAIALLKAFNAKFGPWPEMTVVDTDTVYGTYEYPDVPNGATFALGISG